MNNDNKISRSKLTNLVREIVKEVVKGMDEESGTAAASPVTGPMAFNKKNKPMESLEPLGGMEEGKIEDLLQNRKIATNIAQSLWGNDVTYFGAEMGLGGMVYTFDNGTKHLKKFSGNRWAYYSHKSRAWLSVPPQNITEMTTTSGGGGSSAGTPGYLVPGAFARTGGSLAGVAGSRALGYELTPIGKQDMKRQADKLLENKKNKK